MKRLVWITLSALGLTALLLPFTLPQPPKLWVLSVGQGESVLYRDTTGKLLLFDGGPDDTVLGELGRILPPWHRSIDILALSHKHSDHIRGLISVLGRYSVSTIWESGVDAPGNDVERWKELINEKHIPLVTPQAGVNLSIGKTRALVLHPIESKVGKRVGDQHDATLVLQLFIANQKILLTGDLDEGHEKKILQWCQMPQCSLKSSVLQIPHHGSASGLSPPFLEAIAPRYAFISVGQNNKFKHPRAIILQRLEEARIPYHRTDRGGGLVITFRKDRLSFEKSGSAPR